MALRAKPPEETKKRLKLFMYGPAGVGKTTAAIQFPKSYIIDTEKGTEQAGYVKLIRDAGGVVLRTSVADEVIAELRALMTENHPYTTLVLDPITNIEDNVVAAAFDKYNAGAKEGGDMRVWRDRDSTLRRVCQLLLALDMNVIVTAHDKQVYGDNFQKLGKTYDGWKKWEFMFDLVVELTKQGKRRVATVKKTRMVEFPDGDSFDWSYDAIKERFDVTTLERGAVAVAMATPEQVTQLRTLLDTVKVPEGTVEKWLQKAGVDDLEDMSSDAIGKCIQWTQKRIPAAA